MGGRAAWPTVRLTCGAGERCGAAHRGHARDDFSRSLAGLGIPGRTTSKGLYKVSAGCCAKKVTTSRKKHRIFSHCCFFDIFPNSRARKELKFSRNTHGFFNSNVSRFSLIRKFEPIFFNFSRFSSCFPLSASSPTCAASLGNLIFCSNRPGRPPGRENALHKGL